MPFCLHEIGFRIRVEAGALALALRELNIPEGHPLHEQAAELRAELHAMRNRVANILTDLKGGEA